MENSAEQLAMTPAQMLEKATSIGISKSKLKFLPLILLSFLAGMYIAFGGVFSTVVAIGMSNVWPFGFMKLLQGVAFSLGLILVVAGGAELFTGNMLIVIAWMRRNVGTLLVLRNWGIAYFGNFIGSIFIAGLITLGHSYELSKGEFGRLLFTIANTKLHYGFFQALILGVLCNILVCLAVWLSYSARNTTDKILAIIFPITAFIAAGFEHSVANMFLIPVTLFIKNFDPFFVSALPIDLSYFTWTKFLIHNLFPVTLGNMLGGIVFVGAIYYFSYRNSTK